MEIITIGKGQELVSPNEVRLNIHFYLKGNTYEEVLKKGTLNVLNFINEIMIKNDFMKEDLKTRSYVIREEKKYNEVTKSYEFDYYSFNEYATLKFTYDKVLLMKLMSEIATLENPPMYEINFALSNEKEYQEKVLKEAFNNAKEKAGFIASAAGKKIKECVKVDYKPFNIDYTTRGNLDSEMMYKAASNEILNEVTNAFTPEDILVEETLYTLWMTE